MARFLIEHRHAPHQCGATFASFKGERTPLRGRATFASCVSGGHRVWWLVEAASAAEALSQLPHYVASRSKATPVTEIQIP